MVNKGILKNNFFKFILFLSFLVVCFFLGKALRFDINTFRAFFSHIPIYISGIVFIVLYVVLTFFIWFGPKDVMRVSGAFIFGAYLSTVFVWISEMINVFILFHFSRKLGQGFVKDRFKLTDEDIERSKQNKGFIGTLAIRFNPLVPFRFMDIGAGLSTVSFRKYFFACLLGSPLRIFWLQYILAILGDNLKVWANVIVNSMTQGSVESYNQVNSFVSHYPGVIFISFIYFVSLLIITVIAVVVNIFFRKNAGKK